MSITIKYFASLRESLGRAEELAQIETPLTVQQLWERVAGGQPLPANVLVAVNMEYGERDQLVRDGDEVAFLPPVTGG